VALLSQPVYYHATGDSHHKTIKPSQELASGGAQHPDLSLRGALATWQSLEKQAKEIASLRSQ
jgi:hypothetical protein